MSSPSKAELHIANVSHYVKKGSAIYEDAIKRGIELCESKDILLIAGKGHETYQIIGKEKIHFDDREMAVKYINLKK